MKNDYKYTLFFLVLLLIVLACVATLLVVEMRKLYKYNQELEGKFEEGQEHIEQLQQQNVQHDQFIQILTEGRKVVLTAYSPEEAQTDSSPHITASGDSVRFGGIALSRDFLKAHNVNGKIAYGDSVIVIVTMKLQVNDTMNKRYINRADMFFPETQHARYFGVHAARIVYPGRFITDGTTTN